MIDVASTQGETIQIREEKARQFPAAMTLAVARVAQTAVARRDRHGMGGPPDETVRPAPTASARCRIAS
jgi:hypothetical protein